MKDGKTFSFAKELDEEQRQHELARILGGAKITDNTLRSAQELLLQTSLEQTSLL